MSSKYEDSHAVINASKVDDYEDEDDGSSHRDTLISSRGGKEDEEDDEEEIVPTARKRKISDDEKLVTTLYVFLFRILISKLDAFYDKYLCKFSGNKDEEHLLEWYVTNTRYYLSLLVREAITTNLADAWHTGRTSSMNSRVL